MSDASGAALRVAVVAGVVLAVAVTAAAQSGPIRVAIDLPGGVGPWSGEWGGRGGRARLLRRRRHAAGGQGLSPR